MFERPSADAMSIEKTASQKSASKVWVSVCPHAKACLPGCVPEGSVSWGMVVEHGFRCLQAGL
jgi:hypothetical protein